MGEPLLDQLSRAYEEGDAETALGVFDQLIALEPDSARWLYEKGVLLEQLDEVDGAVDCYQRALAVEPDHGDALVNLGRQLDDRCEWSEALALYDRAVATETGQGDVIAWSNRGNTLMSLGRFDEALQSFDTALAIDAEGPQRLGRQTVLAWMGRVDEANAMAQPDDPYDRGRLVERTTTLPDGQVLVARLWLGRHGAPDDLLRLADEMLDYCRALVDTPPGIAHGVRVQFGWSVLQVREYEGRLVLCEPDFTGNPFEERVWEVGFTLQTIWMHHLTGTLTETEAEPCAFYESLSCVPELLFESERVALRRLHASNDEGHSGWFVGPEDDTEWDALDPSELPQLATGQLVDIRHHLIKVLLLPAGYKAVFDGHAVVSVIDSDGNERFAES